MKLSTKEKTLIVGGAAEVIPMTINQTAKGFRALMSGLYSDPIQSLIREISTNAYDAHVEAGISHRPFLVHLPTQTDRRFRVRDHGRSIKHDAMRRIYTSVLSSTKDGDNTQVGAWGLGSKSPLAYVDSFTVTTYSGTETRTYLVVTGTDGSPQLVCYDPEPSEEPSGVEVIVDVASKDVNTFHEKAAYVYRGFPVKPEGVTVMESRDAEAISSGRNRIEHSGDYYNSKKLNVLQGCVLYPVDLVKVKSVTVLPNWSGELTVEVPIGTVDITPSRESIIYERGTCIHIAAAVSSAIEHLDAEISKRIAGAKNLWEAAKQLHRYTNRFSIGHGARWGGEEIPKRLDLGSPVTTLAVYRAKERFRFGRHMNPTAVSISRGARDVSDIEIINLLSVDRIFVADLLTKDIRVAMEARYNALKKSNDVVGILAGDGYHGVVAAIEGFGIPVERFETKSVPKAQAAGWKPMFGCLVSAKSASWSKQAPNELKPLDELLAKNPDAPVLVTNSWEPPPMTGSMLALCGKTIVTTVRNAKAVEGRKTLQDAAAARAREIIDAGWPSDSVISYTVDHELQRMIDVLRVIGYKADCLNETEGGKMFKEATTILNLNTAKAVEKSKRVTDLVALQKKYPLVSHLSQYAVISKLKKAVLEYIEDCDKRRPS